MRLRLALLVVVLLLAAMLMHASARALQHSEETGGMSASDSLSEVARAAAGDYAPDPNAQIINDDNGGTSVVLSNQNSVHEQTDDTWKIHLVREAQKKTKEENKRKQALEERRKQSYEEANKMDQEEEKHKKVIEQNQQNAQQTTQAGQQQTQPTQQTAGAPAQADASTTTTTSTTPEKPKLVRTCTFSKDAACATNLANKGLAGFILRKDQYDKNPFNEGGDFNQGWKWTHPYLCCASSEDATLNNMFVMAKSCPSGSDDTGFMGALLLKKDYAGNPFTEGGDFNSGWRWTHPVLCKVSDYSKLQQSSDWCLFASTCPDGKWVDKSFSGIIIVNQHYNRQPFSPGGQFNPSWKWAHPKLCCRSA